jgi:hypothetical protein
VRVAACTGPCSKALPSGRGLGVIKSQLCAEPGLMERSESELVGCCGLVAFA